MTSGYSLSAYRNMIANGTRMGAYTRALRAAVTPGCTVIDIGAGPGLFSLLAAQFGAGRVYAVEPDPSIGLLAEFARANGLADVITVVPRLSTQFQPDQPADVLISDIRGALPLFEHHIPSIVDARQRLLRPGGAQLPAMDHLRIALVTYPAGRAQIDDPWRGNAWGLDLTAALRHAVNASAKAHLPESALLGDPATLAELDYRTITARDLRADFALSAGRPGTADGLLVWFDATVAPGCTYSNAPGQPDNVYGQTFFPFERPRTVQPGDQITGTVRANFTQGDYVWSWSSAHRPAAAAGPVDQMTQSTFRAPVLSPDLLATRSSNHRPARVPQQDIDIAILGAIDGSATQGEIAERLRAQFPAQFPTPQQALDQVIRVTSRYRHSQETPAP